MPSQTVYLPDGHAAELRRRVDAGEFKNVSQAVQAAVATHFEVEQ